MRVVVETFTISSAESASFCRTSDFRWGCPKKGDVHAFSPKFQWQIIICPITEAPNNWAPSPLTQVVNDVHMDSDLGTNVVDLVEKADGSRAANHESTK